jgi:hypothetical protein
VRVDVLYAFLAVRSSRRLDLCRPDASSAGGNARGSDFEFGRPPRAVRLDWGRARRDRRSGSGAIIVGPWVLAKHGDLPLERMYGDFAVSMASSIGGGNRQTPLANDRRALAAGREAYTGSCGVCPRRGRVFRPGLPPVPWPRRRRTGRSRAASKRRTRGSACRPRGPPGNARVFRDTGQRCRTGQSGGVSRHARFRSVARPRPLAPRPP